jgi:small subunit ribosomal protein S6
LQKTAITGPSAIATSTAEENKAAESRAKDAAAREAVIVPATGDLDDEIDLDDVDFDADDIDADEIIPE